MQNREMGFSLNRWQGWTTFHSNAPLPSSLSYEKSFSLQPLIFTPPTAGHVFSSWIRQQGAGWGLRRRVWRCGRSSIWWIPPPFSCLFCISLLVYCQMNLILQILICRMRRCAIGWIADPDTCINSLPCIIKSVSYHLCLCSKKCLGGISFLLIIFIG